MRKLLATTLLLSLILALAACGGNPSTATNAPTKAPATTTESPSEAPTDTTESPVEVPSITEDREGNPITLPDKIEKIMCFGPSNTEVIVALGEAGKLIAIDTYSVDIEGIDTSLPQFSMMTPDAEQILSLDPDVIIVTGMSKAMGDDPYKPISDAGICVVYMPSSNSIEGIKEDIRYLSTLLGQKEKGEELVAGMETEIDAIRAIGETITEKKTVYVEIAAAPNMYSFGKGVFLNEMIELIGAENILADQDAWISVADEQVVNLNPDVILTTVNYIDDPVGEIMSRAGWDAVTAVANEAVYSINTAASNRPSHNIVKALHEMAEAIYPDLYN